MAINKNKPTFIPHPSNLTPISLHRKLKGKIEIKSKISLDSKEILSQVYTPGVAEVCREIQKDISKVNELTARRNTVAIVSNGTATLGLGNTGPEAALPVMEGKAMLFKEFGEVDAIPLCINSQSAEDIADFCINISPTFGGINLEDVSAPTCFRVMELLEGKLDIPVFHDDQTGTAVVVMAALINSLKLLKKELSEIKVVVNGIGAAGYSICDLLLEYGVKDIVAVDKNGILSLEEDKSLFHKYHRRLAGILKNKSGSLKDALKDADVFIGVSAPNILKKEDVSLMKADPIIFALSNPTPEIMPAVAYDGGAFLVATGRSDFDNQVNNALVFPGLFRGVLDNGIKNIDINIVKQAVKAIVDSTVNLSKENILPSVMYRSLHSNISKYIGI
ncbi:MAG: NAD-dependent malic enzyme [Candidatus Muiribacterium halophilum]|uniref:NAD-dependent malic enzyme n=1 Tax=Muiribacterium halophilum TaxID=2053465 RepID=A0A2N5ZLD0_MUIH1|nr:MAG: NAD-dependent malic enzyme [Candidatus Muirbacterium halophilum]